MSTPLPAQCTDASGNSIFLYCVSFAAAVLFAVLFGIILVTHIVQAFWYRKPFCWVVAMGAAWEMAGFITRAFLPKHPASIPFGAVSQVLILLAPLWLNGFVYMILGRIVLYFVPSQKVWGITARRLALYFVLLDIFAFIVQGLGGSVASGTDGSTPNALKTINLGLHIYTGGIAAQELFVLFFIAMAIYIYRKLNRGEITPRDTNWKPLMRVMFAALGFITIRIIYRLIEFSDGYDTVITRNEAFYYCLDAVPMFFAFGLFNIFHPGKVLVGPDSSFPKRTKAEKREEKQRKKEEKRMKKEAKKSARKASLIPQANGSEDRVEMIERMERKA